MRYAKLYEEGVKRLINAGIEEARVDCFILFSDCFGLSRSSYFFKQNEEIPPQDSDRIEKYFEYLHRREAHEPVQYIIGNQEFCGLSFTVNENVLIPRLDTEVLVDEILKREKNISLLDMCTGSGCICISLCSLGKIERAVATDISEEALAVAQKNARDNNVNVTLLQGDLYGALEALPPEQRRFDCIVSNPPYIAESERPQLSPEVCEHEPELALFADDNGLDFYKRIIRDARKFLNPGGRIYFEIGCSQAEAVMGLLENAGFKDIIKIKDLAGLDRIVCARAD